MTDKLKIKRRTVNKKYINDKKQDKYIKNTSLNNDLDIDILKSKIINSIKYEIHDELQKRNKSRLGAFFFFLALITTLLVIF